jgi:glycosyltransferase involved in cell wall biosynthesis
MYDGFLAIGKANESFYRRHGVRQDRLFPCRYFVDNRWFAGEAQNRRFQRETIRRDLGILPESVCFLFAGKLERKKRPLDLLRAIRRLQAMPLSRDVHLLVVGDGELAPEARRMVEEFRLPVSLTGFMNQSQMPSAYVAGDCLVLPSDFGETWGLVVNEAMATGLPAIVSDRVGCSVDLIIEGETGWRFRFGDVNGLAHALATAIERADVLPAMGARARALVSSGYSVDQAVDATVAAVHRLQRHREPGPVHCHSA